LHPLTPVLQSWRALGVVAAITAQDGLRRGGFSRLQILVTVAIVLPVAAIGGYLSWRRRMWRVEDGDLRLDYGVITRRSRRVPLARLQAIDVVRPLVARALGLAELRLEVVGHRTTEATLAYLTEEHALAVRAHLLDLAHQLPVNVPMSSPPNPRPSPGPTVSPNVPPAAQPAAAWGGRGEAQLVAVPNGRFVGSLLLSATGAFGLVFIGGVAAAAALAPAAAGVVAATLLPIGAILYQRFTVEFGFTVALSPQGVRLRHGLLDIRHQTVPRGRVQAIRIVEPLLWRSFGWMRVEVDVAGYHSGGSGGASARATSGVLVPVAPRAEAHAVIEAVLPGLRLAAIALRRPPARARWREPLSYHFLGASFDAGFSLTSFGRVRRVTDVVPQDKLQSVRLVQGPWERRLGLATVHLDTAGRNVHAAMWHWDATEATEWTDALAAMARSARARQP
jgi:putative membrane protein